MTGCEHSEIPPEQARPANAAAGCNLRPKRIIRATIPIKHDLYLRSCARIRGITLTALMTRLADLIGQDQLVSSILDDESQIKVRRKGENRYPERV